jgi:5-methylcytosine-specific restriction endonuclease McrA
MSTQAEKDFMRTTSQQLADMRKRCKGKFDERGRMLRAEIPFRLELADYRAWVLSKFRTPDGTARCEYCPRIVSITTFSPDHMVALQRGGSSGTENLAVSCANCNAIKGKVGAIWFKFFLKCLWEMPDADANDIRSRLLKSEKLASLNRRNTMRIQQLQGAQLNVTD